MTDKQQYCTFFLDDNYFGIPLQDVREIIFARSTTRVPLAPLDIGGLINLRGQILTVIDLKRRLGIERAKESLANITSEDRVSYNAILETKDETASLLIDRVGDVVEFNKDSLTPPPATLKGRMRDLLQGAYQVPEGFLLILDTKKVLARTLINNL